MAKNRSGTEVIGKKGPPLTQAATRAARRPSAAGASLTVEVLDGPMDGAVVSISEGADVLRIGRIEGDLVLFRDALVSGRHAELRRHGSSGWMLEDLGSTNGTWLDGDRLVSPHPIHSGSTFVVGQSVLRVSGHEEESFLPGIDELIEDRQRLLGRLGPRGTRAYGAALSLAFRETTSVLTDRHLFLGLAMISPDLPLFARGTGLVTLEALDRLLQEVQVPWSGALGWIGRCLDEVQAPPVAVFFEDSILPSPRLLRQLRTAEERAVNRQHTHVEISDLLYALLADEDGPTCQCLRRAGVKLGEPAELAPLLDSREEAFAPTSRAVATAPLYTSGDLQVDRRAREAARELYNLSARYHLADPDERRSAMKMLLTEEVAQVPRDQRAGLLEQLRRLFPLDAGSTHDAEEVVRIRYRLSETQQQLAELRAGSDHQKSSGIPWELIVDRGTDAGRTALDTLSPLDRPRVEFLRDTYIFATKLEQFILGVVFGLTNLGGAGATGQLKLPGHQISLKRYVRDMEGGRQVSAEELRTYLSAAEMWLVACITGYHEGPKRWFEEYWKKVSPLAIERRVGGWKKRLGLEAVEFWNTYKDAVSGTRPDIVHDEIQLVAREIAKEHQDRWREKRAAP